MNKFNIPFFTIILLGVLFSGCSDDSDSRELTGDTKQYTLLTKAVEGISGTATFEKYDDGSTLINLSLVGTPADGEHPAHIHFNTAVEGGDIAISLQPVRGSNGESSTIVSTLSDGTPITYEELLEFDGYINVHLSAENLGTIVAQGDIGQNELLTDTKTYPLFERAVPGIAGVATFQKRKNGEALATLELSNTPEGGVHPAHIHLNTAAEGGGIALSFNPVDGTTGMSQTNISELDDATIFGFDDVLTFDGYINVHLSASELNVIVAQGDIGQNELTSEALQYTLDERAVPSISGTVTFESRVNGEILATINLSNTPDGGSHPAHIHFNTYAEGGGIALSFNPVDGTSGFSRTNVTEFDNGDPVSLEILNGYDGYVNVHLSANELGTIVAQGDIGENAPTGNSIRYPLNEKAVTGISGEIVFFERVSGDALAVISLGGTPEGGSHPAHIHNNSAAQGGGIALSFTPVNGTTGQSLTHIEVLDDGSAFGYADISGFNGYVNVHLSSDELGTIVAQGDIGSNVSN